MHQSSLKFTGDLIIFDEHIDNYHKLNEELDTQASIDLNKNAIAQYLAFKKGNVNSLDKDPHKSIPGKNLLIFFPLINWMLIH